MTDNSSGGKGTKKSKKLVPIVNIRHRRSIKKETPIKESSEQKSAAFKELVEAAHIDANWERGSGRPRQRYSHPKSSVAFGGFMERGKQKQSQGTAWVPPDQRRMNLAVKEASHDRIEEEEIDDDVFRPMTIPLRPPKRGEELEDTHKLLPRYIEEKLAAVDSDERDTSAAQDLQLIDADDSGTMLFQLPSVLPLTSRKREDGTHSISGDVRDLPEGRFGKMLIYKSGKVRLKMGDVLLDIDGGTPWPFHQQLVAINVREEDGHCVFLGDVKKRAVCTLNVSQLMQSTPQEVPQRPLVQKRKLEEVTENTEEGMEVDHREIVENGSTKDETDIHNGRHEKKNVTSNLRKLTVEEHAIKSEDDKRQPCSKS